MRLASDRPSAVTVVTQALPEDVDAIAKLTEEMDRFYGGTEIDPLEVRVSQINDVLFADAPIAHLIVAREARRRGVGQLLMRHLCEIAVQRACSRVEWTTDQDNEAARTFYAALGHRVNESKLFYRIEGSDLHRPR